MYISRFFRTNKITRSRRIGCLFFFFFKQKTAYEIRKGDWSSDVCSSDLRQHRGAAQRRDDPDRDRQQREQLVLEHERIDEDLGEALRPVGPRLGIAAG